MKLIGILVSALSLTTACMSLGDEPNGDEQGPREGESQVDYANRV